MLSDALRRVSGREGMPRLLSSVYGSVVTQFLPGFRGVVARVIPRPATVVTPSSIAVSRDGRSLLVWSAGPGTFANTGLYVLSVANGSLLRLVGGIGRELCRSSSGQIWVAPDDFVFITDGVNRRVLVLTPSLDIHAFIGKGDQLGYPAGVCANDSVVVVSESEGHRITVYDRGSGAFRTSFGCKGGGTGQLRVPLGLCFVEGDRHVAVADSGNKRVSVFSVAGEFVRCVGDRVLTSPCSVACSAFNELVVAERDPGRVVLFDARGALLMAFGEGTFVHVGVAIHGDVVFAADNSPGSDTVVYK